MALDIGKLSLVSQTLTGGIKQYVYYDTGGETAAEYGDTGFWQQVALKNYGVDTGDMVIIHDVANTVTYKGFFATVNAQDTGGSNVTLDTGSAAGV